MSERTVPAMDRPSIAFARFLDSIVIENSRDPDAMLLTCDLCSVTICTVDPHDTLRVLLNTALAHECGA